MNKDILTAALVLVILLSFVGGFALAKTKNADPEITTEAIVTEAPSTISIDDTAEAQDTETTKKAKKEKGAKSDKDKEEKAEKDAKENTAD